MSISCINYSIYFVEINPTIGGSRGTTPIHIRSYPVEGTIGDIAVNMVDREVSCAEEKPAANTIVETRSPEERIQPERKRRASDEISLDVSFNGAGPKLFF